ncbi:MAG TPA: ribonuclease R [Tepidisphaeraceae bacterium]|nr:ribonuclease R [Tepidisphaeraceae bacterium]
MSKQLQNQIIEHLKGETYRPQKSRGLAKQLNLASDEEYQLFKEALADLMNQGRVSYGAGGTVVLPASHLRRDEIVGTYRQNKRGFGFIVPSDPAGHEDLYIAQDENGGAITGDVVRAKITSRGFRDGKAMFSGRITEIITRKNKRFAGSLGKLAGEWVVFPDGNVLVDPILTPDAASRHIKVGTKVVVELTSYPGEEGKLKAQGVITEVLGAAGEKDVDLRTVIIQHNLPGPFPDAVKDEARLAVDSFDPHSEKQHRFDLSAEVVCTIDPDDAKDYDDAISLKQVDGGLWELGVHIADVSHFVREGTAMDEEARERGNSTYFPGYVIPMLPEILSNGVCSLQEGVPRLCKSAFITLDADARPVRGKFANTIITSANRLRYKEAQAIIDGADHVPHPDGPKQISEYPKEVVELLQNMNALAKRIQKRRQNDGQLVLDLPEVDLVLDEEGKIAGALPEDTSFTHTLIEMFMVEANEAVARLLTSINVPHLRRIHPEPEGRDSDRLKNFAAASGHRLPSQMDRKALQALLASVKGTPEGFAINLAVLKSLTRAEYSPELVGHFALASEEYCHFTSPIRRYADLTIHRLLDAYFEARGDSSTDADARRERGGRRGKVEIDPDSIPSNDDLVDLGKHLSFTERRSEDAERELRQIKILTLMQQHVGEDFRGVVTGITNFGIFIQLDMYLVDGLVRYEEMTQDYWEVDERSGSVKGRRTNIRFRIGDVVIARVVKVDVPRREMSVAIVQNLNRAKSPVPIAEHPAKGKKSHHKGRGKFAKSKAGPKKQVLKRRRRRKS